MNIIFDVHIANPNLANETSMEENIVLNEIYLFVEERVKVLQDEIEKEEREYKGKGSPPAIVIYLKTKAIQPGHFSDELHNKIVNCFSQKDVEIMWLRVEAALQNLMN